MPWTRGPGTAGRVLKSESTPRPVGLSVAVCGTHLDVDHLLAQPHDPLRANGVEGHGRGQAFVETHGGRRVKHDVDLCLEATPVTLAEAKVWQGHVPGHRPHLAEHCWALLGAQALEHLHMADTVRYGVQVPQRVRRQENQ